MNENFYLKIKKTFEKYKNKTALKFYDEQISFRNVEEKIDKLSTFFSEKKLKKQDKILVQLDKSPDSLCVYLTCLKMGYIYVPINISYTDKEVIYFTLDAEPKIFLSNKKLNNKLKVALTRKKISIIEFTPSFLSEVSNLKKKRHIAKIKPSDIAVIIYTSGTTGKPKGALISHLNLKTNANDLISCWKITSKDVLLHSLPIFHVHGLFIANHCALLTGASMIFHKKFEVEKVVSDLPEATVFMGVPTYYSRILKHDGFSKNICNNVRLFVSGSAPLTKENFLAFYNITGKKILERYGMSEAGIITSNPLEGNKLAESVGTPLPSVKVRIVDKKNKIIGMNEKGSIQIKGKSIFSGYLNLKHESLKSFTKDNWFITGDLGMFSKDNYLFILGRSKDLIITGGYNVYPKEIEIIINKLSYVDECVVYGLPDKDFGEIVVGSVVLKKSQRGEIKNKISNFLRTKLAKYKIPKKFFFENEIPRNAMGKVQKDILIRKNKN